MTALLVVSGSTEGAIAGEYRDIVTFEEAEEEEEAGKSSTANNKQVTCLLSV